MFVFCRGHPYRSPCVRVCVYLCVCVCMLVCLFEPVWLSVLLWCE